MTKHTTLRQSLLTIDPRHNGPAQAGHGGVCGGRFAELVNPSAATVRFLAPVPLAEPLSCTRRAGFAEVTGPSGPIASVHPLATLLPVGAFGRVAAAEVRDAEAAWLDGRGGDHIAPTCFACGHRRVDEHGLGLRPGPVAESSLFATAWHPGWPGDVPAWMVWAALDCPSGLPAVAEVGRGEAVVTAELSVEIRACVRGDGDYQLVSRRTGGSGRKHRTEAALVDERGRAVAVATALWITVPLTVMQPDRPLVGARG